MSGRAAVFVGAGLTNEDYGAVDTGLIELFPPIRRGGVAKAMDAGYRVISIIDGEFYQSLAVSPKEILIALRAGCHVLGGSSMGALRAAEMDVYGMEGVGLIYQWYRDGVLTRDDDVALMFASLDEHSYHAVTVPMVNVVWLMREYKRLNLMSAATRRKLTAAARRIHWAERTWPGICERAWLAPDECDLVRAWSKDAATDLKRLDAKLVIERTGVAVRLQHDLTPKTMETSRP
jgi:hypothetical protein